MNVHVSLPVTSALNPAFAQLSADFEAAHAALRSATATRDFDADEAARDEMDRTLVQPAVRKFMNTGERIVRASAATPDEMLLQLRAAIAINNPRPFDSLDKLDAFNAFEELDGDALGVLKSLREGLRRLSQASLARQRKPARAA